MDKATKLASPGTGSGTRTARSPPHVRLLTLTPSKGEPHPQQDGAGAKAGKAGKDKATPLDSPLSQVPAQAHE